jgi:hypothetical protein
MLVDQAQAIELALAQPRDALADVVRIFHSIDGHSWHHRLLGIPPSGVGQFMPESRYPMSVSGKSPIFRRTGALFFQCGAFFAYGGSYFSQRRVNF